MIAVDASVLIAHLNPADTHHEAAMTFFRAAIGEQLVVHPITLAEVLVAGVRIGRGAEMRTDLESLGVLVDENWGDSLRLAEIRVRTGLKMPDCCVLDVAVSNDAALATFDRTLANAARSMDVTVSP